MTAPTKPFTVTALVGYRTAEGKGYRVARTTVQEADREAAEIAGLCWLDTLTVDWLRPQLPGRTALKIDKVGGLTVTEG